VRVRAVFVLLVVMACGDDAVIVDAAAPDVTAFDAGSNDATATNDASDATVDNHVFDAWVGCPNNPVVCIDADYHITVNGNGPPQVLRYDTAACGTADAAYYHVPVAYDYFTTTQADIIEGAFLDQCLGAGLPDGDITAALYYGSFEYMETTNKGFFAYASSYIDASASITFTRVDPPGGIVTGTYSSLVGAPGQPDASMTLYGDFVACRICNRTPPPP
jgi:hypothetical protein